MRTLHTAALICLTTERFHYAICQLKTAVKKTQCNGQNCTSSITGLDFLYCQVSIGRANKGKSHQFPKSNNITLTLIENHQLRSS